MTANKRFFYLAIVCLAAHFSLVGCTPESDTSVDQIVLIDTKTGEAVVHEPVDEYPALNPLSNERTLMPAMYCSSCKVWRAVPTPEQISRLPNGTKCPRCKSQLSSDGVRPNERREAREE